MYVLPVLPFLGHACRDDGPRRSRDASSADASTTHPVVAAERRASRNHVAVAALFVVAALLPLWLMPTLKLGLASDAITYAVAVLGVNLIVGYVGQISLGHGAFVGVGAYTTVILSADHGWPMLATIPVAALFGFIVGTAIGIPALRIKGLYLALLTIGVASAFGPIVKRLDKLTGGANGKSTPASVDAPSWFGTTRAANARFNYLVIAIVGAIVFLLASNLVRGRVGRSFSAIRENELSTSTFGVAVPRYKVGAFGVSAAIAAVAGAMFMLHQRSASDTTYVPQLSIQLYTAAFIGGIGTISGSIAGGIVIVAIPYVFEQLGFSLDPGLVYGAALVALTLFAPDGLAGLFRRFRRTGAPIRLDG